MRPWGVVPQDPGSQDFRSGSGASQIMSVSTRSAKITPECTLSHSLSHSLTVDERDRIRTNLCWTNLDWLVHLVAWPAWYYIAIAIHSHHCMHILYIICTSLLDGLATHASMMYAVVWRRWRPRKPTPPLRIRCHLTEFENSRIVLVLSIGTNHVIRRFAFHFFSFLSFLSFTPLVMWFSFDFIPFIHSISHVIRPFTSIPPHVLSEHLT